MGGFKSAPRGTRHGAGTLALPVMYMHRRPEFKFSEALLCRLFRSIRFLFGTDVFSTFSRRFPPSARSTWSSEGNSSGCLMLSPGAKARSFSAKAMSRRRYGEDLCVM